MHTVNVIPDKNSNSTSFLVPAWDMVKLETCRVSHPLGPESDGLSQVSVTPMRSRSFDETNSQRPMFCYANDQAFNKQALIFWTDEPGFKLMSPERIRMMDHQGLTFLKQCVT